MKVQLNTDVHIDGNGALDRFSEHVKRVEVQLADGNAGTNGQRDHRCMRASAIGNSLAFVAARRY